MFSVLATLIVFLLFFVVYFSNSNPLSFNSNQKILIAPITGFDANEQMYSLAIADDIARQLNHAGVKFRALSPIEWSAAFPVDSLHLSSFFARFSESSGFSRILVGTFSEQKKELSFQFLQGKKWAAFQIKVGADIGQTWPDISYSCVQKIANELGMKPKAKPTLQPRPIAFYQGLERFMAGDSSAFTQMQNQFIVENLPVAIQLAEKTISSFKNVTALEKNYLEKLHQKRGEAKSDEHAEYLNALHAFALGNFANTFAELKALLANQPNHASALALLARLHHTRYRELGFHSTIEIYQKALQQNPLNTELVIHLAAVYSERDELPKAIKLLEKYVRLMPWNLDLLRALGQVYITKSNSLKIFEIYQKILEYDPENAEAFYNLGIHYYHQTNYAHAKQFFHKALHFGPIDDSYLYLATIAEKEDNLKQTILYLQKRIAAKTGPHDEFAGEARRRLFNIMLEHGVVDSSGNVLKPNFLSDLK